MKKIRPVLVAGLLMLTLLGFAQNNINSPYSRYGLGELHGKTNSSRLFAMGGISYGIADPLTLNPTNPASYAAFDSISFLLETGIKGYFITLRNTESAESASYITLSHFAFGFQVTKWWKMSVGILPYSKIGYNVKLMIDLENYSNIVNELNGEGGLNQIFWGNAFNLGKNLRLGFNSIYIFGEGRHSSTIYFPDSTYIFGTKTVNKTRGSDFIFDWGAQYDIHFNEKTVLTLGAAYSNKVNFKAKRGYVSYTLIGGYDNLVEKIKDTLKYIPEEKGSFVLPEKLGFGFSLNKKGSWLVGADYEWENWKSFEYFGVKDSLQNSWKVAVGGEFTPKHTSISPLYKRMSYRMGIHYKQTYVNIRGQSINVNGISFGVKFPLKRSKTSINLGFDIGQRGTLKQGLLKENYFNINFGINILEHWFYKPKYQ